ncbi:hypothetical protein J4458_04460 [Candidatus Woesearchaeota archaeon]|nr:hypothetical protein [Candidatus Woesearchaeota archaeon]
MNNLNKKSQFAMLHPGLMFVVGLIIGAAVVYYLVTKGIIPVSLLAAKP